MNLLLSDPAFLSVAATISGGGGYDPDAQSYITAVEAADGQALETAVKDAINVFVVGCKADGIWNAIKASCILAGARTLSGALVPLKGTAPTNNNFVSGDYNRKTGLVGDGSTKYLDSNRNNNADPQNDQHMVVHASSAPTSLSGYFPCYMGAGQIDAGSTHFGRLSNNGTLFARNRSSNSNNLGSGASTGLIGMSRSSSSAFTFRQSGANTNYTQLSDTPLSRNIFVFGVSDSSNGVASYNYLNARLSFYSIGESLDLALLDARVTTLMTDIGAAIP